MVVLHLTPLIPVKNRRTHLNIYFSVHRKVYFSERRVLSHYEPAYLGKQIQTFIKRGEQFNVCHTHCVTL